MASRPSSTIRSSPWGQPEPPPIRPPTGTRSEHVHMHVQPNHMISKPPNQPFPFPFRETRILPPARPNYGQAPPRDLPAPTEQVGHSQPDETTEIEPELTWSQRLRSRDGKNTKLVRYVLFHDIIDESESEAESESDSDGRGAVKAEAEDEEASNCSGSVISGEEFEVEAIDGERLAPGLHEYWIRWAGVAERTWTASNDCFCPDLVAEMRAVQGADLEAARWAGRDGEVEVLERLRKAAEAPKSDMEISQNPGSTSSSSSSTSSSSTSSTSSRSTSSSDCSDRSDDDGVKREPDLPRDFRANTAYRRLGSAELEQANDRTYDSWIRPQPVDVDALMGRAKPASIKTAADLVDEWRAHSATVDREGRLLAADSQSSQGGHARNQRERAGSYHVGTPTPTRRNGQDTEVIEGRRKADQIANTNARDREEIKEEPLEVQRKRKRKQEDMGSEARDAKRRTRSEAFIKDEQEELEKRQARRSRRKAREAMDRALQNAIRAVHAPRMPLPRLSPTATRLLGGFNSPAGPAAGPVDNAAKLRAAREAEARRASTAGSQNKPRHHFDSPVVRHLQDAMRQSQAGAATVQDFGQMKGLVDPAAVPYTQGSYVRRVMKSIET